MKTAARRLTPVALLVLAVALGCALARACVVVYPTVDASPNFRARAMDRGRPVPGLRLVLQLYDRSNPGKHSEISSVTDANGYAEFRNVNPGSYFLQADHDALSSDGATVEVSPGGAADLTITLQWPNVQPLQVRSLSGQMRAPNYYPGEAQVPLSLSLLEGVSSRVIATVRADDQGRFSFPDVPAGFYFIRLNPSDLRASDGEQIEGLIGLVVSPAAVSKQLDGDIGWSDCGLGFAQRDALPAADVSHICGDVSDPEGAAISKARVLLMDPRERGKILNQSLSGTRGDFALPAISAGTYRLLIMSQGFEPFLREIHLDRGGSSGTCSNPMHVQLSVLL
jgi:hypothetical protein